VTKEHNSKIKASIGESESLLVVFLQNLNKWETKMKTCIPKINQTNIFMSKKTTFFAIVKLLVSLSYS